MNTGPPAASVICRKAPEAPRTPCRPACRSTIHLFLGLRYTKRVKIIEADRIPRPVARGFVYVFEKSGASPARAGADATLMSPAGLSRQDMIDLAAYIGSLPP